MNKTIHPKIGQSVDKAEVNPHEDWELTYAWHFIDFCNRVCPFSCKRKNDNIDIVAACPVVRFDAYLESIHEKGYDYTSKNLDKESREKAAMLTPFFKGRSK